MSDVDPSLLAEARVRVQQLTAAAEQSAGQHNIMLGRLFEAKERLAFLENPPPAPVATPAENTTPVVDAPVEAAAECAA